MEYCFFVPGNPEPQARPRFSVRKDRYGRATGVTTRDEKKSHNYKTTVYGFAFAEFASKGKRFLKGPLELKVIVYRDIPKSYTKKQLKAIENCELFPVQRPDLDNYIKAALDGIGLKNFPKIIFDDDAQVVSIVAQKRFAQNGQLGMAIVVRELLPEEGERGEILISKEVENG